MCGKAYTDGSSNYTLKDADDIINKRAIPTKNECEGWIIDGRVVGKPSYRLVVGELHDFLVYSQTVPLFQQKLGFEKTQLLSVVSSKPPQAQR